MAFDPRAIPYGSEVEGLDVRLDGAALRIALARPAKRNSLSREMIQGLVACIENAPDDERIRVVSLEAQGDHFCGGADWVAGNRGAERPRVASIHRRTAREAHRLVHAMLTVQLPIVCRVRGFAAGIGCHLALASDFALAAEDARFWEPFARRGFTPDSGATWLLPRLVGIARAKRMLLLAREVSGAEAAAWGMIHEAHPAAELDAAADALVAELASAATATVGLTKYALARSLELPFEQALEVESFALELSSRSLDFKEGLAAFRDKRDPEFEGR
ncbi:MAG: enoyl-CoA hydratase/isomerase family protein [Myxococcales bacterium]|nr:enoyl-CoA hydratase/isomerase family protein [Myxococcales bacterium]